MRRHSRCCLMAAGLAIAASAQGAAVPVPAPVAAAAAVPAAESLQLARDDSGNVTIDQRHPLKADGKIVIGNVTGSVDVDGWPRPEVWISGTLGEGVDRLEVEGDASQLTIEVKLPKNSRSAGDTNLKLHVPEGAAVDVSTVSADMAARGLHGAVHANTVSGDVELQVDSPRVTVQTVSGDVTLHAPATATAVNSVSGDLRMNGPRGDLSATTVSGNVELEGGPFHSIKLKTISGDSRLDISLEDGGHLLGESLSGDIDLIVPATMAGVAQLKSFSGEARCSGGKPASHEGKSREYIWGDGRGAQVELSSFSGDIHVERQ
jgi:DUF4097 and DUF4098 domain-containing protein YvlB